MKQNDVQWRSEETTQENHKQYHDEPIDRQAPTI